MSCAQPWSSRAALVAMVAVVLAAAPAGGCHGGSTRSPEAGVALRVVVPEVDLDADVYVDGNYIGQVRALNSAAAGPLRLAPGVHRVEVRKPGRFPVQRTVRVEDDASADVEVQAELLADPP